MAEIYKEIKRISGELEPLRDKYVPDEGKANTLGGEIIRAMDRLIYRFYNDGDKTGQGYGNETCNSSYLFLQDTLGDLCPDLLAAGSRYEIDYEKALLTLIDNINDYLKKKPALFRTSNDVDSRTAYNDGYEYDEYDEYKDDDTE